ncbi:hypothetical protein [Corynebacterium freiburgense]|uniref:hypothetical protein n=1 Tax=Corynebacterium freiburgense TaxID=556548 RepID=UPI000422E50F|nr:hypothetical protein [Corynebacterium freiburgense]WJZ02901.1 hypothetical protein CFREI_08115 [Corynebacterium freiburgense]
MPDLNPKYYKLIIWLSCIILVLTLRLEGLVLAAIILLLMFVANSVRPNQSESATLLTSIKLSAEDIRDVIEAYDRFLHGSDSKNLADRTLHRPALTDPDCIDPDIEAFYYQHDTAQRFLRRLDARLSTDLTVAQMEALLAVTDRRALELKEAWVRARRAASRYEA